MQCLINIKKQKSFLKYLFFKEMYCSTICYQQAMNNYHLTLCQSNENNNKDQLIRHIIDLWRSVHPPPETTSISLVLKLMAMLKQVN